MGEYYTVYHLGNKADLPLSSLIDCTREERNLVHKCEAEKEAIGEIETRLKKGKFDEVYELTTFKVIGDVRIFKRYFTNNSGTVEELPPVPENRQRISVTFSEMRSFLEVAQKYNR
jgi:hypothetical protein